MGARLCAAQLVASRFLAAGAQVVVMSWHGSFAGLVPGRNTSTDVAAFGRSPYEASCFDFFSGVADVASLRLRLC